MRTPFVEMRRGEKIGGVIWLLLYMFAMSILVALVMTLLGRGEDLVQINQVFFVVNFLITCILFRHFLTDSLSVVWQRPGRFFKGILLGFCLYEIGQIALSMLYEVIAPELWTANDEGVEAIAGMNYWAMWAGAVLLGPVVEETLMRGLVFGNLRKKSRVLAYAVSALAFGLIHILQYVGADGMDLWTFILNWGLYLVPSVVLAVTYEYTGTIWGPTALHMILNAVSMGALRALESMT